MSNLLTVSRLKAYRKCARLEWNLYVEGWRQRIQAEALAFGALWHDGMDAMWAAWRDGDADPLGAALAAVAGKATDKFTQQKCNEMLRGYFNRWNDNQDFEVVGIEDEFRAPLLNPATFLPSRTWRIGGKIDKRLMQHGRRLIGEHKTTVEDLSPESTYWLKLQMDHQLSIYFIGSEAIGWPPEGALYDVARKPLLKPLKATPIEDRKYKKTGELYAAQREFDETPEEYGARVREAISENPERYFQRKEIPRTESQIADFMGDAWAQSKVMHESHLAGRAPRNPEACHEMGQCPFWICCSTGQSPEESSDFRRIEFPHPELTADVAGEAA